MIYNMLTISIQLILTGAIISTIFHYVFNKNQFNYIIEFVVATFGSFMGIIFEVWIRLNWDFSIYILIVLQFIIPIIISIFFLIILRLTNNPNY